MMPHEWKARAEAAEAELASVREQADEQARWVEEERAQTNEAYRRRDAAEARVAQLEAALGTALDYGRHKTWCAQWTHPSASGIPCGCDFYEQVSRARALLASQPLPSEPEPK